MQEIDPPATFDLIVLVKNKGNGKVEDGERNE